MKFDVYVNNLIKDNVTLPKIDNDNEYARIRRQKKCDRIFSRNIPSHKFESAQESRSPNVYLDRVGAKKGSRLFEKPACVSPNAYSSLNLKTGEDRKGSAWQSTLVHSRQSQVIPTSAQLESQRPALHSLGSSQRGEFQSPSIFKSVDGKKAL